MLKGKKMWVWDNDPEYKEKRYVIDQCSDGVIAVYILDEQNYLEGETYRVSTWSHHEEIHEPKWRAFNEGEMPEKYKNYWYRRRNTRSQESPVKYKKESLEQLYFANYWIGNETLFEKWEVQIDDKWVPVGVKEVEE